MKKIRNLNPGYIVITLGLAMIISGISMNDVNIVNKTFLCFDKGCIFIQSLSNLVIGSLSTFVGLYLIFKTKLDKVF